MAKYTFRAALSSRPPSADEHEISLDALLDITDGCSGGITWFYKKFLGRDIGCRYCCDEHDLAYAQGGTRRDRRLADRRFRTCLAHSSRPLRAWAFWLAVRCWGWLYWEHQ